MRLTELTRSLRAQGARPLVPFLTAGYPDEPTFVRLLAAASRAGCPIVEIGIPFSDPVADGPLIQASSQQALRGGMTLRRALELAQDASRRDSAVLVLMSYVNPILAFGAERFAAAAEQAGIVGVIVPDVPFEESRQMRAVLAARGIAWIDMVAPTSGEERVARIAATAEGFLYLVSLTGVTGVRATLAAGVPEFVARVRARTELPLYLGFGISDREQAAAAARIADGVIVGSALIPQIQTAPTPDAAVERVGGFLEGIVRALPGARRFTP
jgi:tryptophan synthase alpha chain